MNNNLKLKKNVIKSISLLIILLCLFSFKSEIKTSIKGLFLHKKLFLLYAKYQRCNLEKIKTIPSNSIVIIGHAYGSPSTKEDFLSRKVDFFLEKNIKNINTIIFTGDVFKNFTEEKWNKLIKKYGGLEKILLAPGNHDIGLKNKNSIQKFYNSSLGYNLPYKKKFNDLEIVVEDSNKSNWLIDKEIFNQINEISDSKIAVLVRHNIPIKELKFLSNSFVGYKGGLQNLIDLKDSINRKSETFIVSGDGGAFPYLPRLFCLKNDNLTLIVNGIGDIKNDKVIVVSQKKIFSYKLEEF